MPFAIPEAYRTSDKKEAAPPPPPPPPSVLEGLGASFRVGRDETPMVQDYRLGEAFGDLSRTLDDMDRSAGIQLDPRDVHDGRGTYELGQAGLYAKPGPKRSLRERIADRQARGLPLPQGFTNFDEWKSGVLTRNGGYQRDLQISSQTPWYVRMPAQLAAGLTDPVNLTAGVVTGGSSTGVGLVRGMLTEGLINSGTELLQTPLTTRARTQLGQETTWTDVATNVAMAGALGAGFHAGPRAVRGTWNAGRGQIERIVANNFERLPAPVQARWKAASTIDLGPDDELLADTIEALVPPESRSPDMQAGIAVAQREAQIDRASPFGPHGGGDMVHREALGSTINRILSDTPDPAPAAVRPLRSFSGPADAPAARRGGTAISTRTVAQPGSIDQYLSVTRSAESGGNDTAKAATSSAYGRYQFLKSTWLTYYKRRYGSGGLSDAQILAKRADGNIQTRLMLDLTADNEGMMRSWGVPITNGNRYLMHFAGPGDAKRIFDAPLAAPIESVMRPAAIRANPFLRGKTVGWVMAWSDRKMGGRGHAVRGDGAVLDLTAETAKLDGLRSEVDRLNADSARIRAEMDQQASGFDGAELDAAPARVQPFDLDEVADTAAPRMPSEPLARLPDAGPVETLDLAARVRPMVADKARNLNDLDGLARDLGVSTGEVRTAMLELAKDKGGGLRVRKKDGAFVRRAEYKGKSAISGPDDVLEFIASHGGIRDDEGHSLGLRGLSAEESKAMISNAARKRALEARRSGAKGSRNWQTMTRRSGPLLRHKGRSIDQLGELLDEAGYLHGADGGRPTTAEVLDYLEERISSGKPRYTLEDQARMGDAAIPDEPIPLGLDNPDESLRAYAAAMQRIGLDRFGLSEDDMDPFFLERAAQLYLDEDLTHLSETELFAKVVNEYADEVQWDAFDELGGDRYGDIDYDWSFDPLPGREAGAAAGDGGRPGPFGADARESGNGGAAAGRSGQRAESPPLAELPEAAVTEFLDPAGPAAKAQLDSLAHDARASIDPAIAERQRQQAQLGAEAPMRARTEQDGTMGSPLFDAVDQPEFRLDAEGDPVALRDLMDSFDREAAELKNARDCL